MRYVEGWGKLSPLALFVNNKLASMVRVVGRLWYGNYRGKTQPGLSERPNTVEHAYCVRVTTPGRQMVPLR